MNNISLGNLEINNVYGLDQFTLAFCAIAACLMCIYVVFIFGRKLQLSASTRDTLVQSVFKQEFDIKIRELTEKAMGSPLDPKNTPPAEFGPVSQLWDKDQKSYRYYLSEISYGVEETSDQRKQRLDTLKACEDWERDERLRFAKLKDQAEVEAKKKAEDSVPKSMDISLLGGGFSFLLEFSAVIVIIFTLMTLGILKVLDGKDITTILASIAGYVLGKAGSISKGDGSESKEKVSEKY